MSNQNIPLAKEYHFKQDPSLKNIRISYHLKVVATTATGIVSHIASYYHNYVNGIFIYGTPFIRMCPVNLSSFLNLALQFYTQDVLFVKAML